MQNSATGKFLPRLTSQMLLTMRLIAILILAASLQVHARAGAQTVTYSVKNAPIERVFREIKRQTGYGFMYSSQILERAKPVTISAENKALKEVLDACFKDQPFTYEISNKTVLVKEKIEPAKNETTGNTLLPPPTVHGRIVNEKGEPVPGVSISILGGKVVGVTNDNGEFTLNNIPDNAILKFSAISIETFQTNLNGKTELAFTARTKVSQLEEVIINKGYYSTTQKVNTGSVVKITSGQIQDQPVTNVLSSLEGRIAGAQITQNSGVAGSGFSVKVRGQNSLRVNAGVNDPLYIVDGVPYGSYSSQTMTSTFTSSSILNGASPLNTLNPSDILNIEILKDAEATAIYGSRGSNGVILITTKKGYAGKTRVDVNVYSGSGAVTRNMQLLNTQQYLQMRHEAFANDGVTAIPASNYDINGVWDTTRNTDWQKELIGGTAKITDAQVNLSGGNINTQFTFGGGYHRETTVFPGNNADVKASGHFSLNHSSTNQKLKINLTVNYLTDNNNLPSTDLTTTALKLAPDAPPIYDSLGRLNWANGTWANPLASTKTKYQGKTQNFISNAVLSYEILKDLRIRASLGYNRIQLDEIRTFPLSSMNPATATTASAYFANGYFNSWIAEPQIEYDRKIGPGKLSVLVGTTFQENIQSSTTISGSGFVSDALLTNINNAATLTRLNAFYSQYRYNSLYGRLGYNIENKYLINITARRDGSSRFGPSNQWGNFGAVGLGWVFSEEKFIKDNLAFLSFGKLRGSFGITGSDNIVDYGFMDTYSSATAYNSVSGLTPSRIPNANFGWESNKKFDLAAEFGLLNDRIFVTANWYRNRSSNQLVGYPLTGVTGFTTVQYNLPALLENSGWEFTLNSTNIKAKSFTWTTSINYTIPRSKLISYPNLSTSSFSTTYAEGKSLYIKDVFPFIGVDPNTGLFSFSNVLGSGTSAPNSTTDRQFLSSIEQKFYGGLSNTFKYKGFEFDFLFQVVKQTGRNYNALYGVPAGWVGTNQPNDVLNRWQKPGDIAAYQKFTQSFSTPAGVAFNAAYNYGENTISDASFIRLKNIGLTYNFPSSLLDKLHIQGAKIYLQGQNLLTITKFKGASDPETIIGSLPPLKFITAGVQLVF